MAKFQSPLLGYNNNVRHKNRVFHIQTEDSGVNHPHVITHLFMDGGRILKSVKTSYAEHVGAPSMNETVRSMMKEQHKAMFTSLRDGEFDAMLESASISRAPAAKPAPDSVRAVAPKEVPAPDSTPISTSSPDAAARLTALPVTRVSAPTRAQAAPAATAATASVEPAARAEPFVAASSTPSTAPSASKPPSAIAPVDGQDSRAPAAPGGEGGLSLSMQTRELAPVRSTSMRAPELTLDLDALEREGTDVIAPLSLFHAECLPPPPKNLFAAKEPGTGKHFQTLDPDTRRDLRADEAPAAASHQHDSAFGAIPVSERPASERPSNRPSSLPEGVSVDHIPVNRVPTDSHDPRNQSMRSRGVYDSVELFAVEQRPRLSSRPASVFGATERPSPSIFGEAIVSDQSLDEVILGYLAEDVGPGKK